MLSEASGWTCVAVGRESGSALVPPRGSRGSEDPAVLLFACGALQNLCYEADWSELAVSYDVHLRLESLLAHEDAMIVRYASGALQNITRALNLTDDSLSSEAMAVVKERSLEHRREAFVQQRALAAIAKSFREIPYEMRQRRHESGRRRKSRARFG